MESYKIISKEFIVQKTSKSLIAKKDYNIYDESVCNKWFVMVETKNGLGCGNHENYETALNKALNNVGNL